MITKFTIKLFCWEWAWSFIANLLAFGITLTVVWISKGSDPETGKKLLVVAIGVSAFASFVWTLVRFDEAFKKTKSNKGFHSTPPCGRRD